MKRHQSRPSLVLESGFTLLSSLRPRPSPTSSNPSLPPSPDPGATFSNTHSPLGRSPKLSSGFMSPKTPLLPGPGWRRGAGRRRRRRKWILAAVALVLLGLVAWVYFPFLSSLCEFAAAALRPKAAVAQRKAFPPFEIAPDAKYLTYTPHSGLHNQLIALQNALVIAALLNRTLLVPSLRLGEAVRFVGDGRLEGMLRREGREGLDHCRQFEGAYAQHRNTTSLPEECDTYFLHSDLPANALISLPSPHNPGSPSLPPYILLSSLTPAPSQLSALNVTPASTFSLPDTHVYQYRFYDSSLSTRPLLRYDTRINLDSLGPETESYKHLALGSLFGTSRIKLHLPASKTLRKRVRGETVFTHPAALGVAREVVRAMGGRDAYVAAHVRLGDGWFEREGAGVVRGVWWRLVRAVGIEEDEARVLEAWAFNRSVEELGPPPALPGEDKAALRSPHPLQPAFPNPPPAPPPPLTCSSDPHTSPGLLPLNAPFFLATPNPSHPLLQPILRTFPCAFTLSSFHSLTLPLSSSPSSDLRGPDGVHLGKWFMGIVEALVAAEAYRVVGTQGSTMSAWVEDIGWRKAHGWGIVDRG